METFLPNGKYILTQQKFNELKANNQLIVGAEYEIITDDLDSKWYYVAPSLESITPPPAELIRSLILTPTETPSVFDMSTWNETEEEWVTFGTTTLSGEVIPLNDWEFATNQNIPSSLLVKESLDEKIDLDLPYTEKTTLEATDEFYVLDDGTPKKVTQENLLKGVVKATEVTYSELVDLINNDKLVVGSKYLISDYATIYKSNVINVVNEVDWGGDVLSGSVEPLVVTALDVDKLEPIAFSPSRPQDIIYYDVNNDTDKYSWVHSSSKGVIYRRIDEKGNDLPYDFKNIKFYVAKIDIANIPTWNGATTYDYGAVVKTGNGSHWAIWINVKGMLNGGDTSLNESPTSTSGVWQVFRNTFHIINESSLLLQVSDNLVYDDGVYYISYYFDDYNGYSALIRCLNTPQTVYTFTPLNATTDGSLQDDVHNNVIKHISYNFNLIFNDVKETLLPNLFIGNSFNYNTIDNNFYKNTIGNGFNYNTIGDNFNFNTIGNNFYKNTIGKDFHFNTIGNGFTYNTIVSYFFYNIIGNGFINNIIGNDFFYNSIGNDFFSNTIGNGFNYNMIGKDFNYNTILENVNHFDLTESEIANVTTNKDYSTILWRDSDDELVIEYYGGE